MSEETYTVAGKSMPEISIAVGLIFTLWGVAAYVMSDMASLTAMIPLFVGGPIGAMGLCLESFVPLVVYVYLWSSWMMGAVLCSSLPIPFSWCLVVSTPISVFNHLFGFANNVKLTKHRTIQ